MESKLLSMPPGLPGTPQNQLAFPATLLSDYCSCYRAQTLRQGVGTQPISHSLQGVSINKNTAEKRITPCNCFEIGKCRLDYICFSSIHKQINCVFPKQQYQGHQYKTPDQNHNLCASHALPYSIHPSCPTVLSNISCHCCTIGNKNNSHHTLNFSTCCKTGYTSRTIYIYGCLNNNCSD